MLLSFAVLLDDNNCYFLLLLTGSFHSPEARMKKMIFEAHMVVGTTSPNNE